MNMTETLAKIAHLKEAINLLTEKQEDADEPVSEFIASTLEEWTEEKNRLAQLAVEEAKNNA